MRLYPNLEARIDAWIAKQDDTLSRPEAIRRLVALGLATAMIDAMPKAGRAAGAKRKGK